MSTNTDMFSQLAACYAEARCRSSVLLMIAAMSISSGAVASTPDEIRCGILYLPGQYGPFDYRTATTEQKTLVEMAHFTSDVELLRHGTYQIRPGPDIDYTLRALPNHARALKAMMDLGIREKTDRPFGSRWPVECYFNRALRFAPNDPEVRVVYAFFLLRFGGKKAAVDQLDAARAIGVSTGNLSYNVGLAYFQVQDFARAREYAHKARDLGFDLKGLQNMLTQAGQWREDEEISKPPQLPDPAVERFPMPVK